MDMDDATIKTWNSQCLIEKNITKELRIILKRCDDKKNSAGTAKRSNYHEKKRKFHCKIKDCNIGFVSSSGLQRHCKFKQRNFKYPCENCGKKVVNLIDHQIGCLGIAEGTFHCSFQDCKSIFFTRTNLKRHTKFVHEKLRLTCRNCGKQFAQLKSHLDACESVGDKKYRCTIKNCQSSFITKSRLYFHVVSVHTDPVKCPHEDCNVYMKPRSLKRHIEFYHDRSESLRCKKCGKRFQNIKLHLDHCLSDGVKKFHCQIGDCTAKFVTQFYLKNHVRSKHDAGIIKCPHKNCNKYLKKRSLIPHLKYIHEGLQSTCKICGKTVKRLASHNRFCHR